MKSIDTCEKETGIGFEQLWKEQGDIKIVIDDQESNMIGKSVFEASS